MAREITKTFRDFWRRPKVRAVDGVDLEIPRGAVFGMLGPNGSGKTTTIKMLLGLLHPSSGEIRLFDQTPDDVDVKHRVGYLPEDSFMYRYLTPVEVLHFYGKLFGMERSRRRRRISELLRTVDLTAAAHRRIGEFSKGMTRRLGLAQALMNDPELLILDEPTAGLDPIGCREVKDLLVQLSGAGKTIILSSHLLADVEDVCSQIVVLYRGKVRVQGTVQALLEDRAVSRISVPSLAPDAMRELLSVIRRKVGSDPAVDHPSRSLERFFLDVIHEVHRQDREP